MEGSFIACPDCDLLQRPVRLPRGGTLRCRRCAAVLQRDRTGGVDRALALLTAAAIMYLIANLFPVLSLEGHGMDSATTVAGAVHRLWAQDMRIIATVVLVTAILVPGVEISLLLFIMILVRTGSYPSALPHLVRSVQAIRPWQMLEVFMLGILVSWVKLGQIATVVPGIALWAFGTVIFLLPAAAASFDVQEMWRRCRPAATKR